MADQPKSGVLQRRDGHAVATGGGREKPDKPPKKDKKDKGKPSGGGGSKRNKRNKKDAPAPMSRVVIRRLPPTMTEAMFCEQISVDGQMPQHDEFYFVGPDWTLKQNASCRAYLNFTNPADIFRFTDSFDGYTFVDNKGMEYQAVVEYAPFQKLPKARSRKKDLKCGTIETDTHFLAFKEALEAEEQEALHGRGTQEFSFKLEQEKKTTTTPLLEYIAQKKQEKRDERRRKQEEKRRSREEERQMRKTQIAKAIPDPIKEEREFNDFMERTVLPRFNTMQIVSKSGAASGATDRVKPGGGEGKPKDEKDKNSRNRKDKNRNREKKGEDVRPPEGGGKADGSEKNASKKQDRDKPGKQKPKEKSTKDENRSLQQHQQQQQQQKGERVEKPRKEKVPAGAGAGNSEQPSTSKANPSASGNSAAKKEVKKYSERRKETRARAETRFAEQDAKNETTGSAPAEIQPANPEKGEAKKTILTANVPPFIPKEKTTILLAGHASTVTNNPAVPTPPSNSTHSEKPAKDNAKKPLTNEGHDGRVPARVKESREARKIRNKDRPSMEIYQPRKRIVSGAGKSEDDRGRSDSDRPSDNVSGPTSAAAPESGDGVLNERRHKLTKKASDKQQRERKNGRKNSTDGEGTKDSTAGWWM